MRNIILFVSINHLLATLVFSLSSCSGERAMPDYGLLKSELEIDRENLATLNSTLFQKKAVAAKLKIGDKTFNVKVSYAGKSTLTHPKRNYHIVLPQGQHYQGHSTLRLTSQSSDPSGVRSMLGFGIFASQNLMTPKITPVSLYLNQDSIGLYYLVDIVDEAWVAAQGFTAKSLYKARYGRLDYADFSATNTNHLDEGFGNKSSHDSYADLKQLHRNIHEDGAKMEDYVHAESYLAYMAIAVRLNHWDGFDNNFFLFKDAKDGLFYIVPWDMDKILPDEGYGYTSDTLYSGNALITKFLASTSAREAQLARIKAISQSQIEALIDTYAAQINDAYEQDAFFNPDGEGMAPHISRLKQSLARRTEAL